jgi:hypothetical protein
MQDERPQCESQKLDLKTGRVGPCTGRGYRSTDGKVRCDYHGRLYRAEQQREENHDEH